MGAFFMISQEHAEAITKKLGSMDSPGLIEKLNSLGVGENLKLTDTGISIPKAVVKDLPKLKRELSTLSKAGRTFKISEEGEKLLINTSKLKASYLPEHSIYSQFTTLAKKLASKTFWGIKEEYVELPPIPRGSKVLDVGSGTGFIAEKIKNTFGCDVYALEPSFERSSDYETCVKRLGKDHVEKLTLQEALESNPEKYFQTFDVVVVFKYNVPFIQKNDFLNSLAKTVKPNGVVYITSVEPERFYRDSFSDEPLYLTETAQKYFGTVKIKKRESLHGIDGLMMCTEPKPDLEKTIDIKKK